MEFSPQFVQGNKNWVWTEKMRKKIQKMMETKNIVLKLYMMSIKTVTKTIKTQQTHDCL